MLTIKDLTIQIENKTVLNGFDMSFQLGKNYAILGKNGSGKSSLSLSIMGHPKYEIVNGDIILDGESIKDMSTDQRSKKGIFLAFQNIPEVPGVKLFDFLKAIYNAHLPEGATPATFIGFKKIIDPLLIELNISRDFLFRDLNVGFSGGEKRKIEILQLKLLQPKYIILDEIDSGLDINSIKQLGEMLKLLSNENNSFIIISHYFDILDYVEIDKVLIIENGSISKEGSKELVKEIEEKGF